MINFKKFFIVILLAVSNFSMKIAYCNLTDNQNKLITNIPKSYQDIMSKKYQKKAIYLEINNQ